MIIRGFKLVTKMEKIFDLLQPKHPNLQQSTKSSNNIRVRCINKFHKGGHEEKPSAYLLLEDKKKYDGSVVPAGTYSCFSCGKSTNILGFVQMVLDVSFDDAEKWLLDNCEFIEDDTEEIEQLNIIDFEKDAPATTREVPDIQKYNIFNDYLIKRKISKEVMDKFECGFDKETNCATFPVYVNGQLDFVAKRNINTKFFWLPPVEDMMLGYKPVYGLDKVTSNEIIVCESVINALTCWTYGKQAVALFGLGTEEQMEDLINCDCTSIILGFDGDTKGQSATEKWLNYKPLIDSKIISYYRLPFGKDINDLSEEEFRNLKIYNKLRMEI